MGVSSRGLFNYVARLRLPPPADSDSELLDRFVRSGDEAAFAGLVRRHGAMVMSVCQRRLGRESDAEDAFQAVFLALATSAGSITRSESLAGWLYRVAYLIALKAAGRRARLPVAASLTAEVPMPDPPAAPWETQELKAIIDAELAGLPDKFRSVIVLCLLEGQTNTEAAAMLGVPVGTVDSRLSTARRKLQDRLVRRGIALAVGVTLEQMLGGPLGAADRTAIQELVSSTVRAVLAEAAGPGTGAVSPAVVNLAQGVKTMLTSKLRLFAAVGITLGLLGGAGAGVYFATAADPARAVARAEQKLPPEKLQANAQGDPNKLASLEAKATPAAAAIPDPNATGMAALMKPFGKNVPAEGAKLEDILQLIEDQSELVLRVDVAAFRRIGEFNPADGTTPNEFLKALYETPVVLPRKSAKLLTRDVLSDALAQIRTMHPCTFQIRGSQLLIVPAYVPPVRPGVNPLDLGDGSEPAVVVDRVVNEQIYGGVVSVQAERKALAEVLADLRKQTGANIVLDPRCDGMEKKSTISVTLNDVRLYDALRVIADMSELKMVYAGNIYYVTTPANAKSFEPAPRPPQPQPAPAANPQPQPGVAPAPQ